MAPLTLHASSLTHHSALLETLTYSLQALNSPPPSTYPPVTSLYPFLSSLFKTLTTTATTLSCLSHSASETSFAPFPSSLVFTQTSNHLSTLSSTYNTLSLSASNLATNLTALETAFKHNRGALAETLVECEDETLATRKTLRHAERRLREMDQIVGQARREERGAVAELVWVRCCTFVLMPIKAVSGRRQSCDSDVEGALRRKRRASGVVDRCSKDRVEIYGRRADELRGFIDKAGRMRQMQRALGLKEACVQRAVEDFGAVRALERALMGIGNVFEDLAECCRGVEAIAKREGKGEGNIDVVLVEQWHTITVALRFFHSEHVDAARKILKLFQQV